MPTPKNSKIPAKTRTSIPTIKTPTILPSKRKLETNTASAERKGRRTATKTDATTNKKDVMNEESDTAIDEFLQNIQPLTTESNEDTNWEQKTNTKEVEALYHSNSQRTRAKRNLYQKQITKISSPSEDKTAINISRKATDNLEENEKTAYVKKTERVETSEKVAKNSRKNF